MSKYQDHIFNIACADLGDFVKLAESKNLIHQAKIRPVNYSYADHNKAYVVKRHIFGLVNGVFNPLAIYDGEQDGALLYSPYTPSTFPTLQNVLDMVGDIVRLLRKHDTSVPAAEHITTRLSKKVQSDVLVVWNAWETAIAALDNIRNTTNALGGEQNNCTTLGVHLQYVGTIPWRGKESNDLKLQLDALRAVREQFKLQYGKMRPSGLPSINAMTAAIIKDVLEETEGEGNV